MKGFSAEPGERSARVTSIQPGRSRPAEATAARTARVRLDHQDGGGGGRPARPPTARPGLQPPLQRGVEGGDHGGLRRAARRGRARPPPARPRRGRARGGAGARASASRRRCRGDQPARATSRVEHLARARRAACRTAVGTAGLGGLGQGDQQGLLAVGEAGGLVAEIGEEAARTPSSVPP